MIDWTNDKDKKEFLVCCQGGVLFPQICLFVDSFIGSLWIYWDAEIGGLMRSIYVGLNSESFIEGLELIFVLDRVSRWRWITENVSFAYLLH